MSERPSDALQPNTKRRAGAQGGKDDEEDEEEAGDPGNWQPDPDVIAKRRKVRARRADEAAPVAASVTSASANPFAGISIAPPSQATSNPFASISLVAPSATKATETPGPAAQISQPPASEESSKEPETKDNKPETAGTPGFGFYASANPFAALTTTNPSTGGFGGFSTVAASGGGFGSVGGFGFTPTGAATNGANTPSGAASASVTPLFGATPKPSGFSFGTGAFPIITPITSTPATAGGEEDAQNGDGGEESVEVFGDSTAEFRPVVQLPEKQRVNGEEDECVAFSADSTLFEFDSTSSKWRERGKGEFKLNLDKSGQARMVMRQTGNYRLLLNAKVFAGMASQLMPGGGGVTFGCANHAVAPVAADGATPEKKEDKDGADEADAVATAASAKVSTWALRIKSKEQVARLLDLLEQHAKAAGATPEVLSGGSPRAGEEVC